MSAMLQTPSARLARSREQLRLALADPMAAPAAGANTHADDAPGTFEKYKAIPGVAIVIEALGNWWAKHPLRLAAIVTARAASAVAKPVAQRHPLGLVVGAFLVGGAIAWSRPWRWGLRPALFAGLVPQLILSAMRPARSDAG